MYNNSDETIFIPDINPTSSFSRDINKRCHILETSKFKVAKLSNFLMTAKLRTWYDNLTIN
jgi:hypothetical protein